MADRNYRRGYRDQYDRERSFSRQEEQFEPGDYDWRDEERAHRQRGEERGDFDYGRFETSRSYRDEPSYSREADHRAGRDRDERGWFERAGDEVASWFGDEDAERRRRMDYRGHGPAGCTRSDGRVREDACDALTDDWGVDARRIEAPVSNGDTSLDGTVPSRAQKRRAEELLDDLSGVRNVQNNLRVEQSGACGRNNRETESAGTL